MKAKKQIMKNLLLSIIFILTISCKAQDLRSNIIGYYEFKLCNSPHTIILIEKRHKKYKGLANTSLKKKRKNGTYRNVKKRTKISPLQTKIIIEQLKYEKIDSLNKNYDDDSLTYLDGDHLVIKFLRNNKIEEFEFEEIYPVNSNKVEKTPLRGKVQNWLNIIDNELNMKNIFSKIKQKLKRGTYCYESGAIYKTCINMKK
jgi:hypothetical protein